MLAANGYFQKQGPWLLVFMAFLFWNRAALRSTHAFEKLARRHA